MIGLWIAAPLSVWDRIKDWDQPKLGIRLMYMQKG